MAKLENLRVCEVVAIAGGQQGVQLSSAFRKNIHVLICGGYESFFVCFHIIILNADYLLIEGTNKIPPHNDI